ncbi:hypothetical protein TNCV_3907311 [Trichonephila clavipes]|nr:hypothetical protein TNCV_3907311 [Trichonephila clavipes]
MIFMREVITIVLCDVFEGTFSASPSSWDGGIVTPLSSNYIRLVGGVGFSHCIKGSRGDNRRSNLVIFSGARGHRNAIILSTNRNQLFSCVTLKRHSAQPVWVNG